MRTTMLIAIAGALFLGACSSDDTSSSDNGPVITGPAVVDLSTTAEPSSDSTTGVADASLPISEPAAAETAVTEPAGTTPTTAEPTTTTVAPTTTIAAYDSEIYGESSNWICRGDVADVCDEEYPLTEVASDATLTEVPYAVADDSAVDCFYVYPTVSGDPTFNSDLVADNEIGTTQSQAARFNQECTVYAPLYRSVTAGGLFGSVDGDFATGWRMAYEDVLDAWRYYLANLNQGRPVVILAHSQGSFHVVTLLREEIDPSPSQRDLIVSAIIPGTSFQVAKGDVVGGDTQNMPLCRAADQVGCVITFQTYRASVPPTSGAIFGRPGEETDSACTNPGALAGGPAILDGAFGVSDWVFADPATAPAVETPLVGVPGLVTGECLTTADGYNYLGVTVNADPTDARGDDIPGDGAPNWGLHTIDMNVAQDTLIDLVQTQVAAYQN